MTWRSFSLFTLKTLVQATTVLMEGCRSHPADLPASTSAFKEARVIFIKNVMRWKIIHFPSSYTPVTANCSSAKTWIPSQSLWLWLSLSWWDLCLLLLSTWLPVYHLLPCSLSSSFSILLTELQVSQARSCYPSHRKCSSPRFSHDWCSKAISSLKHIGISLLPLSPGHL